MRTAIENRVAQSDGLEPEATAGSPSSETPEAWRRRAKCAEAKAVALEAENKQLRSARTNAVLAAARAEKSAKKSPQPNAEEAGPRLDALATGMKIAEEARREADRQRENAVRRVKDSLRQEYTQRIEAIRRCHAAELSAQFQEAEAQARQAVTDEINALKKDLQETRAALAVRGGEADSIRAVESSLRKAFERRIETIRREHAAELTARCRDAESRARQEFADLIETLTNDLKNTQEALRKAGHERESAVRRAEESLKAAFCEQYEALRERHAAELAAQSSAAKKRFGEELMASLATAHAAWQADTEKKLQKAKREARDALARADAAWRRRSKAAIWQAAMVWRARERQRLNAARRHWQTMHRAALDACNCRWRAKLDRLKRTARRSPRQWAFWPRAKDRVVAFAKACAEPRQYERPPFGMQQSAIGHTGCVAVILILVAIHFSPTGAHWLSRRAEMTATAAAQTARQDQIAQLPRGRTAKYSPARSDRSAHRARTTPRRMPAQAATIRSDRSRPDEKLTDADLRLRLEARIERLRAELSTK